jgi:hypothetical protein
VTTLTPAPRGREVLAAQAGGRMTPVVAGPRVRTPTAGPELDLITEALRSYEIRAGSARPLVFREPELPTGFPDVVAVFCRPQSSEPTPTRCRLGPDHLRLLHHVYRLRRSSAADVAVALRRDERGVRRLLDDLEEALLLRQIRDRAVARALDSVFIATRIVAIEAKIHDWQRALRQAVANTWFASHSYVLMPLDRVGETLCQHAARLGIGLMTYDGSRIAVRLRPRRLPIPSSYGSWLVNEWAVGSVNHLQRC